MIDKDIQLKLLSAVWHTPTDSHYLRAVPDEYFTEEKFVQLKHKLLEDEPLNTREVHLLKQAIPDGPVKLYAHTIIEDGYLNAAQVFGETVTTNVNRRRIEELQGVLLNPPSKPSLNPPMTVQQNADVEITSGVKFSYEYPMELKRIQYKLNRLYPGSINVVAADNGGGKSLYLEQVALGLAKADIPVCDFSIEMPFVHRLFRYIQHQNGTQIGLDKYFEGQLSAEDIKNLTKMLPTKLYIQNPNTINDVLSVAEQLYRHRGVTVFTLDFLQALRPLKGQQKYEAIAYSMESIYHFSKRFPTVWFIASQYNRDGKRQQRTDKDGKKAMPSNSDLLGANEIETYAWTIGHILRDNDMSPERQFFITKNRFGMLGEVPMKFNDTLLTFEAK